ncbi:unknown [Salmonella phage FelixO1]|uniref:Uncharacterized protein n=1 Tax=Salmonella phage Felix O1 (isolate Felix O1-VT1) TaxID=1283336 RepID=Q6KGL7_BPFO1|nr:unknown [Salmonella phage FelixO1]
MLFTFAEQEREQNFPPLTASFPQSLLAQIISITDKLEVQMGIEPTFIGLMRPLHYLICD